MSALMTVNIAVLAPAPNARVSKATLVNPGERSRLRTVSRHELAMPGILLRGGAVRSGAVSFFVAGLAVEVAVAGFLAVEVVVVGFFTTGAAAGNVILAV